MPRPKHEKFSDREGSTGSRPGSETGSVGSSNGGSHSRHRHTGDDSAEHKWSKRTTAPCAASVIILEKNKRGPAPVYPDPGESRHNSVSHGNRRGFGTHPKPPRAELIDPLDLEPVNPNYLGGKSRDDVTMYPPIVTIDGRVDTDLDHLIEDENDDDEDYDGPVDEVPSRYPKPHVFSVIPGSLDDDVDSYANDDGTMEHTLVDAPKNFHPRDLKDVASSEQVEAQARLGKATVHRRCIGGAGTASSAATGQAGSQLLSYSDRSHNKMHTESDNGTGGGIDPTATQHRQSKWPDHLDKAQLNTESQQTNRALGSIGDQKLKMQQTSGTNHTVPCSDSTRTPQPKTDKVGGRKEESTTVTKMFHEKNTGSTVLSDPPGYHVIAVVNQQLPKQQTPGKSASEQAQRLEKRIALDEMRRPVSSSTIKRSSGNVRRSLYSSPRHSSTRNMYYDEAFSDSNDEYTFITCRESMGSSWLKSRMNDPHRLSAKNSKSPRRSPTRAYREGYFSESNVSSVTGIESIGSDLVCNDEFCDPREEIYSSDPPLRSFSPFLSDVMTSKSDSKTALYYKTKHDGTRTPVDRLHHKQSKKHTSRGDAVEWYEDNKHEKQRMPGSPRHTIVSDEFHSKSRKHDDQRNFVEERFYVPDIAQLRAISSDSDKGKKILNQMMLKQRERERSKANNSPNRKDKPYFYTNSTQALNKSAIWHGTEKFKPIHNHGHEKDREHYVLVKHGNSRRSYSPKRLREISPLKSKGPRNVKHGEGYWLSKRPRNPFKDPQQMQTLKNGFYDSQWKHKLSTEKLYNDRRERRYQERPRSWTSTDGVWQRGSSPTSEWYNGSKEKQDSRSRRIHKSLKPRQDKDISPYASWSFESCRSIVETQRSGKRMPPYNRQKMKQKNLETIARTIGSPVDDTESLKNARLFSSKQPMKHLDANSTEDVIKASLNQAMNIAKESLTAAARVSRMLNLVMTNSNVSLESSKFGSTPDPRSPNFLPDRLTKRNLNQHVPTSANSSRYTDLTVTSSHPPPPPGHPSPASIEMTHAENANKNIHREQSPLDSRFPRSKSALGTGVSNVISRDRFTRTAASTQSIISRPVSSNTSTPLVSIFIGTPSHMQQQMPTQVAQIFSSHVETNYPNVPSAQQAIAGNETISVSRQDNKPGQVNKEESCNQKQEVCQKQDTTTTKEESMMKQLGLDGQQFLPVKEQTICVNTVTMQQLAFLKNDREHNGNSSACQGNIYGDGKVSDSSSSQSYESTTEILKEDYCKQNELFSKHLDNIPTHEDGSVSPSKHDKLAGSMKRLTSPLIGLTNKITSSLASLTASPEIETPEARAAKLSEALKMFTSSPVDGIQPKQKQKQKNRKGHQLQHQKEHERLLLYPDQISPPRTEDDKWSDCSEYPDLPIAPSPCPFSPGSCVDPYGYLSDGSAVDPPLIGHEPNLTKNINWNWSKTRYSHHMKGSHSGLSSHLYKNTSPKVEKPTCVRSQMAMKISPEHLQNHSLRQQPRKKYQDNDHSINTLPYQRDEILQGVERQYFDKGDKSYCELSEKDLKADNSQGLKSQDKSRLYKKLKHPKDKKNKRNELEPRVTKYGKDSEDILEAFAKANGNNNCSSGSENDDKETYSDNESNGYQKDHNSTLTDDGAFVNEEAEDWNENQPSHRYHRSGPITTEALATALNSISNDREHKLSHPRRSTKSKRSASERYRAKQSLYVAAELANQSLSAAARVTELLNQVVDVYQFQHPDINIGVEKLVLPQHLLDEKPLRRKRREKHVYYQPSVDYPGDVVYKDKRYPHQRHGSGDVIPIRRADSDDRDMARRCFNPPRRHRSGSAGKYRRTKSERVFSPNNKTANKQQQVNMIELQTQMKEPGEEPSTGCNEEIPLGRKCQSDKNVSITSDIFPRKVERIYKHKDTMTDLEDFTKRKLKQTRKRQEHTEIQKVDEQEDNRSKSTKKHLFQEGKHQQNEKTNDIKQEKEKEHKNKKERKEMDIKADQKVDMKRKYLIERIKALKKESDDEKVSNQLNSRRKDKRYEHKEDTLDRPKSDNENESEMIATSRGNKHEKKQDKEEEVSAPSPEKSGQRYLNEDDIGTSVDLPMTRTTYRERCDTPSSNTGGARPKTTTHGKKQTNNIDKRKENPEHNSSNKSRRASKTTSSTQRVQKEPNATNPDSQREDVGDGVVKDAAKKNADIDTTDTNFSRSKPQSREDRSFSPCKTKRGSRLGAVDDQSKISPMSERSIYEAVVQAFSKSNDNPPKQFEGGNRSFNKAVENASLQDPHYQSIPVKHRYPISPSRVKEFQTCQRQLENSLYDGKYTIKRGSEKYTNRNHEPNRYIPNAWCENRETDTTYPPKDYNRFEDELRRHERQNNQELKHTETSSDLYFPGLSTSDQGFYAREYNVSSGDELYDTKRRGFETDKSTRSIRNYILHGGTRRAQDKKTNTLPNESNYCIPSTKKTSNCNYTSNDEKHEDDIASSVDINKTDSDHPVDNAKKVSDKSSTEKPPSDYCFFRSSKQNRQNETALEQWRRSISASDDQSQSLSATSSEDEDDATVEQFTKNQVYDSDKHRWGSEKLEFLHSYKSKGIKTLLQQQIDSASCHVRNDGREKPAYASLRRENSFHMIQSPSASRQNGWIPRHSESTKSVCRSSAGTSTTDNRTDGTTTGQTQHNDMNNHPPYRDTSTPRPQTSRDGSTKSFTASVSNYTGGEDDFNLSNSEMASHSPTSMFSPSDPNSPSAAHLYYYIDTAKRNEPHQRENVAEDTTVRQSGVKSLSNFEIRNTDRREGESYGIKCISEDEEDGGDKESIFEHFGMAESCVPQRVSDIVGPGGRGTYPLYRPLDNIRCLNFSPIIEEAEITGNTERAPPTSRYSSTISLDNSKHRQNNNNNNNNINKHNNSCFTCTIDTFLTSWKNNNIEDNKSKDEIIGCDDIQRAVGIRESCNNGGNCLSSTMAMMNFNNNATSKGSLEGVKIHDTTSNGSILNEEDDFERQILLDSFHARRNKCKNIVQPIPFIKTNRLPLPPIQPTRNVKPSMPVGPMSERERYRLHQENTKFAKGIIDAQKHGCTIDTGLKTPVVRQRSTRMVKRVWELERISKDNEKMLEKIINKEPYYKRNEQLDAYDKLLPKMLMYAKHPEALIKFHKLEYK